MTLMDIPDEFSSPGRRALSGNERPQDDQGREARTQKSEKCISLSNDNVSMCLNHYVKNDFN